MGRWRQVERWRAAVAAGLRRPGRSGTSAPATTPDRTAQVGVDELVARVAALEAAQHRGDPVVDRRLRDLVTEILWAAAAPLAERPLVSCVLPTAHRDRAALLRSAVDSVVAQTYPTWELLVVDDATDPLLEPRPSWWPVDPRVRILRSGAQNASVARNTGLDAASGDVVAYLDDDCRWFPWWLHAVVGTLCADPDLAFVHGVRVVGATATHPVVTFAEALEPLTLHVLNPLDTNVLAHRAGIAGVRWDPDATVGADYDLAIRLSSHRSRFVPVPAATYSTTAPDRIWAPDQLASNEVVVAARRRAARRARPLRVVAHNTMYPLLCETYIGDELEALHRHDVDLVLSRDLVGPTACPLRPTVDLHESLQQAIEAHDPDLVLTHWATNAPTVKSVAARAGVPYAVRRHSFDAFVEDDVVRNDWCVGTWSVPSLAPDAPRSFVLPTLVVDPPLEPGADGDRDGTVTIASSGLPKRDWPVIMDAVAASSGHVEVLVARTDGHLGAPDDIAAEAARAGVELTLRVDVPFAEVQTALRRASVVVYGLAPAERFVGQPRSVIEAGLHGTPTVVPDRPAMRALVGTAGRYYTPGDAASLAAAIRAQLDEPPPAPAREALAARLRSEHGSPPVHEAWTTSLTRALVDWRREHRPGRTGDALRFWSMY